MASGILGRQLINAANTAVYTVPSSKLSVVNINVVNMDPANSAIVRLAVSDSSTPSVQDYIEYNAPVTPNGILERTGIVMDASKVLVAYANSTNTVSVVAYGFEENA